MAPHLLFFAVETIGLDNEQEMKLVFPQLLQGDYLFDISPMNESLMRAERKAEATSLFQLAMAYGPINVGLAQAGAATPLNWDELFKYVLEQNDLQDPERFFSAKQPPPQQMPGPGAGGPGAAPAPGGPPQGVTAQQSIDPSVSPSAGFSMSGEQAMQQYGAMRGGINNQ